VSASYYAVLWTQVRKVYTNWIACPSATIILHQVRRQTDSPIPHRYSMFHLRPWLKSKKKPNTQDWRFWFTSGRLLLPCVGFIRKESERSVLGASPKTGRNFSGACNEERTGRLKPDKATAFDSFCHDKSYVRESFQFERWVLPIGLGCLLYAYSVTVCGKLTVCHPEVFTVTREQ
jgi:hypothetical protein